MTIKDYRSIGYSSAQGGEFTTLYECSQCGAVVSGRLAHDVWHKQNEPVKPVPMCRSYLTIKETMYYCQHPNDGHAIHKGYVEGGTPIYWDGIKG